MIKNQLGTLFQDYIDYKTKKVEPRGKEFSNIKPILTEFELLQKNHVSPVEMISPFRSDLQQSKDCKGIDDMDLVAVHVELPSSR